MLPNLVFLGKTLLSHDVVYILYLPGFDLLSFKRNFYNYFYEEDWSIIFF